MNLITLGQDSDPIAGDSSRKQLDIAISFGAGPVRFFGDVQDASEVANVHVIGNRAAYDLSFGIGLSRSFMVNFNAIYGKLSGNENTFLQHRNFQAQMVQAGLNVEYNFGGLYKDKIPVFNPFLSAGFYYANYFNIGSDLQDENGVDYHYYDGKIWNLEENNPDAVKISRDYSYETYFDKRSAHSASAMGGLGVDLHISRSVTVRLMSRYFHSFSDDIDGVNDGSFAESRDGFLYNTLSLLVNPMAIGRKAKETYDPKYKYLIDLDMVEKDDLDNDGVFDLKDLCAATPEGVKVDKTGCPLDSDKDGIPDYRDKEPTVGGGEIVDQSGVPVNYELVAQRWSESPDVYGIRWDKKYDNPRFVPQAGYTVNVDVIKKKNENKANQKILLIPELRKEVINDSIIVYRLGVYEKFETSDAKRNELVADGIYTAYTVPENASLKSGEQVSTIAKKSDNRIINSYGVQESISKVKLSDAHSSPQLDFTISRFERYLFDGVDERALVEPYLQAISAFAWDPVVKEASDLVFARLAEFPIPASERKALAKSSKIVEELVESALDESDNELNNGTTIASNTGNSELRPGDAGSSQSSVDMETERKEGFVIEKITIENSSSEQTSEMVTEQIKETKVQEATTQPEPEVMEEPMQANSEPDKIEQPAKEPLSDSEILSGEPLKQAIEQIRSTSKLNEQPRINYAPTKPEYKLADVNDDQLISAMEIQMVLEDILKGQSDFTSEEFNRMNAYFTDFTQNVEPIDFGGTKVAFVNGTLTILKTEGGEYKMESRRLLAKKYREADFNKDGELTPEEVQKMISLFMKGDAPYSQEKLHELIDLYFD